MTKRLVFVFGMLLLVVGIAFIVYLQNQPDGKISGAQSIAAADRNGKFKEISSQIPDPDLFSYGAEIYVKTEIEPYNDDQFEKKPLFSVKQQYKNDGELADMTATKLPAGTNIFEVAKSSGNPFLAAYVDDEYVLYRKHP